MADITNIPTGIGIPTQIPLDSVAFIVSESLLSNLGTGNALAYKYYEGLKVHCITNKTSYIWREVLPGEENTGLVAIDFTYPPGSTTYGIDYSNRTFNFFLIESLSGSNFSDYIQMLNVGTGKGVFKDFNPVNSKFEFKSLNSSTLSITESSNEISINTPETASIPALYVNNLYVPSYSEWLTENILQNGGAGLNGFLYKGKGTISQPFTDDVTYPLAGGSVTITPNTAIQNALDGDITNSIKYSFRGAGTRLVPERLGQNIIIQNNSGTYTFPGNFSYAGLRLIIQGSINATTAGYIVDMDDPLFFNSELASCSITIEEGATLQCSNSLGFRNSGNTSALPPSYNDGRIIYLLGEGLLYFSYSGPDILTRYIFNGDGNNNDDNLHFQVTCKVRADQQGIYLCSGKSRMDFYNLLQSGILSGTGNVALKAFHMTGGQVRFYEKGSIYCGNETTGRTYGLTFAPSGTGIGYCSFQLNSARVAGNAQWFFAKLNNEDCNFNAFNSPSGDGFSTTNPGSGIVVSGLFENLGVTRWNVSFKNNVFTFTGIDHDKVDLTTGNTVSAINFIGNELVENLMSFASKADALAAGHPTYSAFIKRTVVNAVDLEAGIEYRVVTAGSPSLGTVGDFFTATGSETGTGTASLEVRSVIS